GAAAASGRQCRPPRPRRRPDRADLPRAVAIDRVRPIPPLRRPRPRHALCPRPSPREGRPLRRHVRQRMDAGLRGRGAARGPDASRRGRRRGADPEGAGRVRGRVEPVRLDPRLQTLVLTVHILALCLALGPLIFFGAVVAPASFSVLPTHDMAGALQSPILSKLCLIGEASFLVLFGTSWLLTANGTPKLTRSLLTRLPILGFFAAIVIRQLLIPQIDRIRLE